MIFLFYCYDIEQINGLKTYVIGVIYDISTGYLRQDKKKICKNIES